MALPDYLIIGAMKCGTSTLAAQLGAQPGLFMTTPKEPNYFSDDDIFARGPGWYQSLFDDAAPGDLKGEASTHYTKLPTLPDALPRLTAMLDTPKIIYLIRDPIARAVSHYIHEWTTAKISGDIDTAITHYPELVSYGLYGSQIAPWVAQFGAQNILVLSLEVMQRAPQQTLDQVGHFLGRDGLRWNDDLARVNASDERVRRLPLHWLIVGNPVAGVLRRALVPRFLRDRVRKSRQMQARPELSRASLSHLRAHFAQDRAVLLQLFPDRPDLHESYRAVMSHD